MNMFRIWILLLLLCTGAAQYWNEQNVREEEFFNARLRERPRRHVANRGAGRLRTCLYAFAGGVILENMVGKFETMREVKRHKKEMKEWHELRAQVVGQNNILNQKIVIYNDLTLYLEALRQSAKDNGLDRWLWDDDYKEFKEPDTNNDEKISKQEFNAYIKEYLRQNPYISSRDVPRFEDFDVDKNGYVSFAEWQAYLDRQQLPQV